MTPVQIAAARQFAPPLITVGRVDRRGARLRSVNSRAVDYARRAGMSLETVYPEAVGAMRALAPPMDSAEAVPFMRAAGLTTVDVYPPWAFAGETPAKKWSWGWVVLGALVGAVLGGPIGAVAIGAATGGFVGGVR